MSLFYVRISCILQTIKFRKLLMAKNDFTIAMLQLGGKGMLREVQRLSLLDSMLVPILGGK